MLEILIFHIKRENGRNWFPLLNSLAHASYCHMPGKWGLQQKSPQLTNKRIVIEPSVMACMIMITKQQTDLNTIIQDNLACNNIKIISRSGKVGSHIFINFFLGLTVDN